MVTNLPQLRQAMTRDGGLEALINIASTVRRINDRLEATNRAIALQCLTTHFAVRGPESIRVRSVEAQIIPLLISILELFWRAMEPEIRSATERGLRPRPRPLEHIASSEKTLPSEFVEPIRPPQSSLRRRAATVGSIENPVEMSRHPAPRPRGGLYIRIHPNPSPLGMHAVVRHNIEPDHPPNETAHAVEQNGVEMDRNRMDVDLVATASTVIEGGGSEEFMADVESLRSPPSEEHDPFSSAFTASRDAQDASSQSSPDTIPVTLATPMDVDDSSSQSDPLVSVAELPVQAVDEVQTVPLPRVQNPTRLPVPPNAPLVPYAVPPIQVHDIPTDATNPSHPPPTSTLGLSKLYSREQPHDWWIPKPEVVQLCLEALAYLSKYPKLREHFNSTRFAPTLLQHVPLPGDSKKEVNVFEIVERFTFKLFHTPEIQGWASIVMRHYSRKDDIVTKRQCANMQCRKWETDEQKFISCSKCKYVSSFNNVSHFLDVHVIVRKIVSTVHGQDIYIGVLIVIVRPQTRLCRMNRLWVHERPRLHQQMKWQQRMH
jgi:hypothetical protein